MQGLTNIGCPIPYIFPMAASWYDEAMEFRQLSKINNPLQTSASAVSVSSS